MVAFFRQFIVVLLVLLQYAAPLVHAHTGRDVSQGGLHLYEFETLHLVADSMSMTTTGHAIHAESCIVNVGSAINQQQTFNDTFPVFCLLNDYPVFAVARDPGIVKFTPHNTGFAPPPFLNHNFSRAPPL